MAIRAERATLCAVSPFFRALFRYEEGAGDKVLVGGIKGPVLQALVAFYHMDQLPVGSVHRVEAFVAADMLLMDDARDHCLKEIVRRIDMNNCIGMAALAQWYPHYPALLNSVLSFLEKNFDMIWRRNDGFSDVPGALILEILASDELNVNREVDVLHAIDRWFSGDGSSSSRDSDILSAMLHCVRVGLCDTASLEQFERRCRVLVQSPAYKAAVRGALERGPCSCSPQSEVLPNVTKRSFDLAVTISSQQAPETTPKAISASSLASQGAGGEGQTPFHCPTCGRCDRIRWRPRLPYETLFVVGGMCGGLLRWDIETYDCRSHTWSVHPGNGLTPRYHHGVAVLGQKLYVVGGMECRDTYTRTVDCLDTERHVHERRAPIHEDRAYLCLVTLGEHLYAIGGRNRTRHTATVERYSPNDNKWTYMARMNQARSDAAACSFEGKIYVSGGFDGVTLLDSVEVYNPSQDLWSLLVMPLPSLLCGHQMIAHGGHIYVIGGYDSLERLKSVIRSQPGRKNDWQSVQPLRVARSTFAVAELDGEIYVIGGSNGNSMLQEVECYSWVTNSWRQAPPISNKIGAMAACTVKGLKTSKLYCGHGREKV